MNTVTAMCDDTRQEVLEADLEAHCIFCYLEHSKFLYRVVFMEYSNRVTALIYIVTGEVSISYCIIIFINAHPVILPVQNL
jgi:hypothetical protein